MTPSSTDTPLSEILVVSDDEALHDEVRRGVAGRFVVRACAGGLVGLGGDARPAAVVLDLDLPAGDGLEQLTALETHSLTAGLPVVVVSTDSDFSRSAAAQRQSIAGFVGKPLRAAQLVAALVALTGGRAAGGHGRGAGSGGEARGSQPASGARGTDERLDVAGRQRLGELLVEAGVLGREQLHRALDRQRDSGARLGELLVKDGLLDESQLASAVARQMRTEVVDLTVTTPQAAAVGLLPREFIVRRGALPLRIRADEALEVAMVNPLDIVTIDEISMRGKRRVVPLICTQGDFDEAVVLHFSSRGRLRETTECDADDGSPGVVDAGIIEIVDSLLTDASSMGASDIHLEPYADALVVRCRIDGVLQPLREFPKELQAGITSRLKIMANLNIAERRLPQDGRTSFETASGRVVDLRLASLPCLHGENITIRILEVSPLPPTLAMLGLDGDNLARFEQALARPEGGMAIVGPTGSGKSTTLYTTLELIRTPERKIYTVEDPVERRIDGVVQTEIKPHIGLTFAHALRSLVRADPDVIMVGEIRDVETAKMAADAAVTGHKVFSTLHTNDAAAAVTRLVEMGVPQYLVAAAWNCFVAQRLVRRLCPHCRRERTISAEQWHEFDFGEAPEATFTIFEPAGCSRCFGTGYRGRIGLYEVLTIDDELRELITAEASHLDLRRAARAKGVTSLQQDGVAKVLAGSTSHLELLRVTL